MHKLESCRIYSTLFSSSQAQWSIKFSVSCWNNGFCEQCCTIWSSGEPKYFFKKGRLDRGWKSLCHFFGYQGVCGSTWESVRCRYSSAVRVIFAHQLLNRFNNSSQGFGATNHGQQKHWWTISIHGVINECRFSVLKKACHPERQPEDWSAYGWKWRISLKQIDAWRSFALLRMTNINRQ